MWARRDGLKKGGFPGGLWGQEMACRRINWAWPAIRGQVRPSLLSIYYQATYDSTGGGRSKGIGSQGLAEKWVAKKMK
ncbi:hypothetical protein B7486_02290 [cyanobacterium TDX16]|nr:hypothetical protein B7486_02290 [cyanobacterium TDX16]